MDRLFTIAENMLNKNENSIQFPGQRGNIAGRKKCVTKTGSCVRIVRLAC